MLASTAGTFSSNDFIADLSCDGALLAAGVQNLSNQRLLVWSNVDTAAASTAPSFSGALPASPKRVFTLAGRHYVLTQTDVVVLANPNSGNKLGRHLERLDLHRPRAGSLNQRGTAQTERRH